MSNLIERQVAKNAICNACGKIDCDQMDTCEKINIPSINSSEIPNSSDTVGRKAVLALDIFTKIYCRDDTVTDDLVFRCSECGFEVKESRDCLVKCLAIRLCPDYKGFGSMGDL